MLQEITVKRKLIPNQVKKGKVLFFVSRYTVYYGQSKQIPSQNLWKKRKMPAGSMSYDNVHDINKIPGFHPNHNLGNHIPVSQQTHTTFTTAS